MSAFMVDDAAFAEVARFLSEERPDVLKVKHASLQLTPVLFAVVLSRMNGHSFIARYPGSPVLLETLPLYPIDPLSVLPVTAVQCLKQLHCIRYQSCETPRYLLIADFVNALAAEICPSGEKTPGYDDAAWGNENSGSVAETEPYDAINDFNYVGSRYHY